MSRSNTSAYLKTALSSPNATLLQHWALIVSEDYRPYQDLGLCGYANFGYPTRTLPYMTYFNK